MVNLWLLFGWDYHSILWCDFIDLQLVKGHKCRLRWMAEIFGDGVRLFDFSGVGWILVTWEVAAESCLYLFVDDFWRILLPSILEIVIMHNSWEPPLTNRDFFFKHVWLVTGLSHDRLNVKKNICRGWGSTNQCWECCDCFHKTWGILDA